MIIRWLVRKLLYRVQVVSELTGRQLYRIGVVPIRILRRTKLSLVVITAVLAGIAVAAAAYLVLQALLPSGQEQIQPKDLTQFAFTAVAGIGGVVALVVAYRRQHGTEQNRFVERFGAAAKQLGDADVAVRLAGVYAMAGVADEAGTHQRQQCIDVLCGYLRLPYSPALGANHEHQLEHRIPGRAGKEEKIHKYQYRQNDKVVRESIVRIIAAHLHPLTRESWSNCTFDFSGALLESPDFSEVTFGRKVSFRGATLSGSGIFWKTQFKAVADFREATFVSGASFHYSRFRGRNANFDRALFKGNAIFEGTRFRLGSLSFEDATFEGDVCFDDALLAVRLLMFRDASFTQGATFKRAVFNSTNMWFQNSSFKGRRTTFEGAEFHTFQADFTGVVFASEIVSFEHLRVTDCPPLFDWTDRDTERDGAKQPDNVLPHPWPPVE